MADNSKPVQYSLDLSRQAERFLRELSAKQARQIAEKLQLLTADPGALPAEQLRGYAPMRCLRAGEFWVIYAVEGAVVQVQLIGKRNDDEIYRALGRSLKG
jgi:mRNA-degrading endonuclease RelE of RelBE toxin-antitoxin system